ncbi:hypothetical protein ACOMHN_060142 [Nucella lapillus]
MVEIANYLGVEIAKG